MLAGSPAALLAFSASTFLVVVAASLAPRFTGHVSRSGRIAVSLLAWNVLVVGPVYLLGLTDRLYAHTLALAIGGASLAVVAIAARRFGVREVPREVGRTLGTLLRAPLDALRLTVGARSFGSFGVLLALVLVLWMTAQAVLLPTWGDWDCLWYHEPMIGFAIQNHGFSIVDLPPMEQKVNGYPRLSEMTMLWLGIFHGRWAIDLVNPIVVPMLAAGAYRAFRAVGADPVRSVGWAAVAVTLPGIVRVIPTTLVDAHGVALAMVAIGFGFAPRPRIGDGVVAAVALAMAMGVKLVFAVPMGMLALVVLGRLVARRRSLGAARVGITLAFGLVLSVAVLAFTFVRNHRHFHNPLWPDIRVVEPRLGIDWPGNFVGVGDPALPPADRVPSGATDQLRRLYARPGTPTEGHAWQILDYGLGLPWAILPSLVVLPALVLGQALGRGRIRNPRPGTIRQLLLLLVPSLVLIPAFHIGRYHLVAMLLACMALESLGARIRAGRYLDVLVGLVVVGSTMSLAWNDHGLVRPPIELRTALTDTWANRLHGGAYRSPDVAETARARERDLRPGEVVVFDRIAYLALLWDDHYTNRVVWLGPGPRPLERAKRLGARWIYASQSGGLRLALDGGGEGVERVGTLESEGGGTVYRIARGAARTARTTRPSQP